MLLKVPTAKFRDDSSYLVVGGLGGIGQSVCHWMADHGARNLIILSRSANTQKADTFVIEMERLGCKTKAIGCDISDALQLNKALDSCLQEMPPIRGGVQGAMVLQVSMQRLYTGLHDLSC